MQAQEAGTVAPPFTMNDIDGKSYSLPEALKQGPVLLAFFKVSCPTSQFTFPFLERLHQAVKGSSAVRLWGVSQNDARDTRAFAQEYGLSFPLLLDEDGYPVSNGYGLTNVPTLFLIQPDGTIRVSSVGFNRKDIEEAAAEFGKFTGQPIQVFLPGESVPDSKPG
jgi:peroxiredoxin